MATYTINAKTAAGVDPNKKGVIVPDGQGRYRVTLGALEYPNSVGAVYDERAARAIFEDPNCIFVRKLRKGALTGELGHPVLEPGMTEEQYFARIVTISETNESHTILEVTIDTTCKDAKGNRFVGITGLVKPSGPNGHVLKAKLDDPDLNVAFSIRSLTKDRMVNGVLRKYLVTPVTWDVVTEPGLAPANKWDFASFESVDSNVIKRCLKGVNGIGLEASNTVAAYAKEILSGKTDRLMEISLENAAHQAPVGAGVRVW